MSALPAEVKAERREMVVIVNEPVRVEGKPGKYWMVLAIFSLRAKLTLNFKSRMGSTVARICKSLVRLMTAGVMMLSERMSHPRSAAVRM